MMTARTFARTALGLLLLQSLSAAAWASPPGDGSASRDHDEFRHSASLVFVHLIRTELKLSDAQVLQLMPHMEAIEATRKESAERRHALARRLRELAEGQNASDRDVKALVRELDEEEERARADQNRRRDEILDLLDPQQQAKFVLFANRLRRRVEQQMQKAGQLGGGPDARRRRGMMRRDRRPGDDERDQRDR